MEDVLQQKIIIQKKVWDEKKDYIKFVKYLFIGNTSLLFGMERKGKVQCDRLVAVMISILYPSLSSCTFAM